MFAAILGLLLFASYHLMGSNAGFLASTYGFVLSVPELTPNMGLFWYFFTEMFEHFRLFFVATFQLNVFVYVVPLSIRLRKDPFLLAFTLIGLVAVFKSYPTYGDVGFYLSMLPLFAHLFPYTKQVPHLNMLVPFQLQVRDNESSIIALSHLLVFVSLPLFASLH